MKFSTKIQTLEDGVKSVGVRDDESKPLLLTLKGVKVVTTSDDEIVVLTEDARLKALEDEVLEKAKVSKVEWFGKDIQDARLEGAFIRSHSADGNELTMKKAETIRVYDSKRALMEGSSVEVDDSLDVVVQLTSVEFLRKTFEAVWVIHQAKHLSAPKPKKAKVDFSECMFEETVEQESEDEDEFF